MSKPLIMVEKVKQDLHQLRLKDMADALDSVLLEAEKERQGYLAFLDRLISIQVEAVNCRSIERRIKRASLYKRMSFECFDWNFQTQLNVPQVKDLSELGFITKHQSVLIFGKTGTGKTHLATALGLRACEVGYRVRFYKFQQLLNKLYSTLADDTTDEFIDMIARFDLLIIDEVRDIRSKPEYPSLFLDLINACQDGVSIIITSNVSIQDWASTMGNPSITNAIADRLFHKACIINITKGRSYRTQGPCAPTILYTVPEDTDTDTDNNTDTRLK